VVEEVGGKLAPEELAENAVVDVGVVFGFFGEVVVEFVGRDLAKVESSGKAGGGVLGGEVTFVAVFVSDGGDALKEV